jgi:hypothetical protein
MHSLPKAKWVHPIRYQLKILRGLHTVSARFRPAAQKVSPPMLALQLQGSSFESQWELNERRHDRFFCNI